MIGPDKDGKPRAAKWIHGGCAFVLPFIQSYEFLDLNPVSFQVDVKRALSKDSERISVYSRYTIGITTEEGVVQNAVERLLGVSHTRIQELANDIIIGQTRLVISSMDAEEITSDNDKFLEKVAFNVENELKRIGLRIVNFRLNDIIEEN